MGNWYYFVDCILMSCGSDNQLPTFGITDTKFYVPFVTLSTQRNVKLLDQLKSGFKRQLTGIYINQKSQ